MWYSERTKTGYHADLHMEKRLLLQRWQSCSSKQGTAQLLIFLKGWCIYAGVLRNRDLAGREVLSQATDAAPCEIGDLQAEWQCTDELAALESAR